MSSALGLGVGLVAAIAIGRLMSTYLFGVRAADPVPIAGVAGSLLAVGWIAAWLPARRASRIRPAEALRN
jgi:ABC-type antimicrobial peptide transport system permease subunit